MAKRLNHIKEKIRHAFSLKEERLQAEEILFLERMADILIKKDMVVPAVFYLESTRSLSFMKSQFLNFISPIIDLLDINLDIRTISSILAKREGIDVFIHILEEKKIKIENERQMI